MDEKRGLGLPATLLSSLPSWRRFPTRSELKVSAEGANVARVAARLSSTYVLRALHLIGAAYGGDLLTGIIAQSIVAANTSYLDESNQGALHAGVEQTPPDELRRPVSVLSLAGFLGLPFETTRRYVNRLIRAGYCVRVKGGVIVPKAVLERPELAQAIVTNVGYVRRFARDLRRAGVVD